MKRLIMLVLSVFLVVGIILVGGFLTDAFLVEPGPDAKPISFEIAEGTSVRAIAKSLEEEGLIEGSQPFLAFMKFFGEDINLQAGLFTLMQGMSYQSLADTLSNATSREVQVTIPEGYTLAQIKETLQTEFDISDEAWEAATGVNSPLKSEGIGQVIPANHDLEGYLFPDTYRFRVNAQAEDIARKMMQTLEKRLADEGLEIDHDDMTLAGLLEREVRGLTDMKLVADIFLKRLEIGMPLQADSTVNYVTGKKTPGASLADLEIDSPYNTYKYKGLPPGPISHPGIEALIAVKQPTSNDYFYFLTTPTGEVKYASTFVEHIENRQYLR